MVYALSQNAIVSLGDVAATAVTWRSDGQMQVTVIAKATFSFATDAPMPRSKTRDINRAEVHYAGNPERSARFASDLAPHLGRVDVIFTGSAYAPRGASIRTLPVRLGLFDGSRAVLDKMLIVRDPAGFQQMPIVYERAFGGMGNLDNPVGVGVVPGSGEPNIVDLNDATRPAGYGPISRAWPSRRRLLSAALRAQIEGAAPDIPEPFNWAYFQSAPIDQRIDALRGDEWIVMDGLHPEHPRIRMRLPGAQARAQVYGLSSVGLEEGHPLDLVADTLHIDGDEQVCSVVWRRTFPMPEALLGSLRIGVGVELPGEPIPWPERVSLPPPPPAVSAHDAEMALSVKDFDLPASTVRVPDKEALAAIASVMPFRAGPAPEEIARPTSPSVILRDDDDFSETLQVAFTPVKAPLPFGREASPPASKPPPSVDIAPAPEVKPAAPAPEPKPSAPAPPEVAAPPPPKREAIWAPEQPAPAAPTKTATKPPAAPVGPATPTPALKKGLYGKFGGKA